MFDNTDFAFNDLFHNGHIGSVIVFDCIIFRVCIYLIYHIIKQISFTRSNFFYRPIIATNIIVGSERAFLVCCVLSNKVITFKQTIYGTAEFSVTLCVSFFVVLFCNGYSEFFEYIVETVICNFIPFNSCCLVIRNDITNSCVYFFNRITPTDKDIIKMSHTGVIGYCIFINSNTRQ